jgi:hypothetical protein
MNEEQPIEQKPMEKKQDDPLKYKKALRLSIGVIVLLAILLMVTVLSTRQSIVYKSGYIAGWNDCRAKQIELMQNAPPGEPIVPYVPQNLTQNKTNQEDNATIQIVVE